MNPEKSSGTDADVNRSVHWWQCRHLGFPNHTGGNRLWRTRRLPVSRVHHSNGYEETDSRPSLILNSYITEVVEPAERTGAFGQLGGCAMFGGAFGFFCEYSEKMIEFTHDLI